MCSCVLLICEETEGNITMYIYDASGSPIGFTYHDSTYDDGVVDTYWYTKNMFGDIVGVYNSSGTKLVSYSYNPWGEITTTYRNNGSSTTATKNNLKYRGYYYDTNLAMYYLQSRYYDAKICRFISPDDVSYLGANGDLLSYNLYAYCSNNPINKVDPTGEVGLMIALVLIISTVAVGAVAGIESYKEGNDVGQVIADTLIGMAFGFAIGGAIVATGGAMLGAYNVIMGTTLTVSGLSALNVFAVGALALDSVAFLVAPILGIEMEAIEYENASTQHSLPDPSIPTPALPGVN